MTAPAAAAPRTADGPLRVRAAVVDARPVGGYAAVALHAPAVAERAAPGQFVSLGVDVPDAILRRPFSVYAVDRPAPGAVEVVFDVVGRGTAWLAARRPGDEVDLVGPLGRAFPAPPEGRTPLLVGGGYGAAPVLFLAEVLAARGVEADLVLGAATADRLLDVEAAERFGERVRFTTDDGSLGVRGMVTDVLPALLGPGPADSSASPGASLMAPGAQVPPAPSANAGGGPTAAQAGGPGAVFACGPMPMLRAVAALAAAQGVPSWVAVEEHMACGTGVCWTCVLPVRGPGGQRNLRACTEGPVFDGAATAWEAIGTPAMGNPPLKPARPAPGQAGA